MTVALVQMKNISKFYGQVCTLENVHLTVGEREPVGLFGDNGGDKFTPIKFSPGPFPLAAARDRPLRKYWPGPFCR